MAADGGYGSRSQFETEVRVRFPTANENTSWSFTPLDKMSGDTHCLGVALRTSPRWHSDHRPRQTLAFCAWNGQRSAASSRWRTSTNSVGDPQTFHRCSGNGLTEWNKPTLKTVQGTHGLLSTSEWTGVQFATIAREVGLKDGGSWVLAEGADAAVMTRSIPMEKMLKDAVLPTARMEKRMARTGLSTAPVVARL